MKKLIIFAIAALGMLACTEKNKPEQTDDSHSPVAGNGVLPGKFSVSSGKQIQFSQGNLQYQASTKTWRFAETQYDIIGTANTNISSSYTGWIDLFGWGTGNKPTLASTNDKDYATFTDWGVNKISNGGNKANMWRTLTHEEWEYLFQTRTNAQNLCGQATVAGVHGFVFLPDNWSTPSTLTWQAMPCDWTTNQYNVSDWSKMETAGAVFLPTAGRRAGTEVYAFGTTGCYWSSTPGYEDVDCLFLFDDEDAYTSYYSYCYLGLSVRLVR